MSIVMGYDSFDAKNDFLAATERLTWWLPITHWSIVLGIWIGSLSLLSPHADEAARERLTIGSRGSRVSSSVSQGGSR